MYTLLQRKRKNKEVYGCLSLFVLHQAELFMRPLLQKLDNQLDTRLVRTFYDTVISILRFRNRSFGLVLSQLGAYVLSPEQAPAGTKRLSNLLRSKKWAHTDIESYQLDTAKSRASKWHKQGEEVLMLWDDSVIEKPESWYSEGLCSVPSSKGKRLTRIKTGFFTPPKARICVPGFDWSAILITTRSSVPCVCMMRWWTTRGKHLTDRRSVFIQMLKVICKNFTQPVIHVLDRGYASIDLIIRLIDYKQSFILRWDKRFLLKNDAGICQNAGKHAAKAPICSTKPVYDNQQKKYRQAQLAFLKVSLPKVAPPLFLVICKDRQKAQEPLLLLTNCPIESKADAWRVVYSYMRRWTIEQAFKFMKSDLAIESPRLWFWENR
jgi:hypothetical protein